MSRNRRIAALLGLSLCLALVLAPVPAVQAQDIRVYTQPPGPVASATPSDAPFVVLTLDLSILQLLSGGGGPLDSFFGALGIGEILNLDTLLGDVNTLLTNSGITPALDALGIVKALLYPLLNQLVGLRLAIVASYTHEYCDTYVILLGCHHTTDNGAAILFTTGTNTILGHDVSGTLSTVVDVGEAAQAVVDSLGDPDYTLGAPFQGVAIYDELVDYLTQNGAPAAPPLTSSAAVDGAGNYVSPLTGVCLGTDIYVINLMLSNSAQPDLFAQKVADYDKRDEPGNKPGHEIDGFSYNGGQYYLKSSFLLTGPGDSGVLDLVHNALGTTNMLLGLTGLGGLLGNQIVPAVHGAGPAPAASNQSLGAPQVVQNRIGDPSVPLYIGRFSYDPASFPAWSGNLAKLTLDLATPANPTVQQLPWPGTVANTNASCSGPNCADVYYQTTSNTIVDLDLDATTIDNLCGTSGVDCNSNYLTADDKLEAAKQVAWARGYEVRREVLSDTAFKGLLGFLDGIVVQLEDVLKAVTGILFGIDADPSTTCDEKSCGPLGLNCILGGLLDALEDLLSGILSGVLGLDFGTCIIPPSVAPPARQTMGDILHSHPLAIDYGTTANPDVRIFFGTNTGFLHQFSEDTGREIWRLAPQATMQHFGAWSTGDFEHAHGPYGVDGAPVAQVVNTGSDAILPAEGDQVTLYFGMGRGGSSYYALDVTEPDAKPTLAWQIQQSDADFSELGLTFSMPALGDVQASNGTVPVLIFGGGYDLDKDPSADRVQTLGADDDDGNALFVVNALTGALIWKAVEGTTNACTGTGPIICTHSDLTDSIPSAPAAVDTDGDGLLDRVYVGDTGGQVWRADIGASDPAQWGITRIANLGRHASADIANDRRFFHAPDVVQASDGTNSFLAVTIASGNRAAPLQTGTNDWIYVLMDGTHVTFPITPTDLRDLAATCTGSGCPPNLLNPNLGLDPAAGVWKGWQMPLAADGEKALSSPVTLNDTVVFTSYVPPAPATPACAPQTGTGQIYAMSLATGAAADGSASASTVITPPGIPATPQYVGAGTFIVSQDILQPVDSQLLWRTWWRDRRADP